MAQMRKIAQAAVLSCSVLAGAPLVGLMAAQAQEDKSAPGEAERLVGEGLAKMLQALDLLLKTVPQYAAPEVQPNGDIIIRRLHREEEVAPPEPDRRQPDRAPSPDEGGDSTET